MFTLLLWTGIVFAAEVDAPAKPLGQKIIEKVLSPAQLPTWLPQGQVANGKPGVPATLVYVRVSRSFLEDYVERNVRRPGDVRDCILGTRVVGKSHTRGTTGLILLPNDKRIAGEVVFKGTVHYRTVGYNSPAVLHQESDATFRSRKPFGMAKSGLDVASARTNVSTRIQTKHIGVSTPGLRGRIATRIAWRRTSRSRPQAEAISSQHTAEKISRDFDKRINGSVAKVEEIIRSQMAGFEIEGEHRPAVTHYRSTPEYAELTMVDRDVAAAEGETEPPPVEGNPDVAVRVHRTILGQALTDPQLREKVTPMLVQLLAARFVEQALPQLSGGEESPVTPNWFVDLNWLALDFTDAKRQLAPLGAAKDKE